MIVLSPVLFTMGHRSGFYTLEFKGRLYMSSEELMLLNCGVGEDYWESLGLQGDPTSPS